MVDTNSNPNEIDFPIPANDDASKSIALIIEHVASAIEEGLSERKMEKEKETNAKDKKAREEKAARLKAEAGDEEEGSEDEDEVIERKRSISIDDEDEGVDFASKGKAKKAPAKKPAVKRRGE